MKRYKIVEESISGHCCFEYSIVDTGTVVMTRSNGSSLYRTMCECFDLEGAQVILDALNKGDKK